jgi:homoserine trans-succinylase
MTRKQLIETMDYEEFLYWQSLYNIRPWGEDIKDLRSAIVASASHNAGFTKDKLEPKHFMPYRRDKYKGNNKGMADKLKAWQAMYNKR